MSNPIHVIGTVATEPKLVATQSGVPLCTFRLASGDRRFDRAKNQWVDGETNWYTVTAFRSLARHSHQSLQKGQRIIVSGRLRVRRWETSEKSGTSVEIDADAVGHDLRWGVSSFERTPVAEAPNPDSSRPSTADPRADSTDSPAEAGAQTSSGEESVDGFMPKAA